MNVTMSWYNFPLIIHRERKPDGDRQRRTCFDDFGGPTTKISIDLDRTLSVGMVLKSLGLSSLDPAFEQEEVNSVDLIFEEDLTFSLFIFRRSTWRRSLHSVTTTWKRLEFLKWQHGARFSISSTTWAHHRRPKRLWQRISCCVVSQGSSFMFDCLFWLIFEPFL